MLKRRLSVYGILLGVCFGLGLGLGVFLPRWGGLRTTPKVYNTAVILKQVQTLSQLVTVKYVMEKIVVLDDPSTVTLRTLLPDDTHVTLLAHGIVKAGVDLARLTPADLQVQGNRIVLTLPRPQITDAYLDDTLTRVVEHKTGMLRFYNKDLEQTARQNAVDDIRRAARSSGILKDAEERAREQLSNLLRQLGFEQVDFCVQ